MKLEEHEIELRVQAFMARFRNLGLISQILLRLENELSDELVYHNLPHTLDVMHEALFFGVHDGLSDRELELLAIAAAYHDAGFLEQRRDNEELGASFAVQAMKEAGGYSPGECEAVRTMVIDTRFVENNGKMRQEATTKLSGYLVDADLSNIGREDFLNKYEQVRSELGVGDEIARPRTRSLVQAHEWYTDAAKKLREAKKRTNLETF